MAIVSIIDCPVIFIYIIINCNTGVFYYEIRNADRDSGHWCHSYLGFYDACIWRSGEKSRCHSSPSDHTGAVHDNFNPYGDPGPWDTTITIRICLHVSGTGRTLWDQCEPILQCPPDNDGCYTRRDSNANGNADSDANSEPDTSTDPDDQAQAIGINQWSSMWLSDPWPVPVMLKGRFSLAYFSRMTF